MAGDIVAWTYTDDLGNTYSRGVAKYITVPVDGGGNPVIGGVAESGVASEPFNPAIKPRTVSCLDPITGKRRRLVVMNIAGALWTGSVTSINLYDGDHVAHAYTVYSRTGERRRVRAPGL